MNFNNQDNMDAVSAQLHDLSFTKPTQPMPNSMNYGQPAFLDSIGVQRSKSPFSAQNDGPLFHTGFQKPQMNPIMNSWGQGAGYQQPMTPSTSLSSAATPSTPNNVQLSNYQFDPSHSVNSSIIHPAAPRTAPAAGLPGHYMPPILSQEPQWNYVDQTGQIQGPFSSTLMDSWYSQRFFMQALQIKLSSKKINPFGMDEFTFITLMELILKVSDYVEPFKKFDIICWQFQQQLHDQPSMQSPIASPISLGQLTQSQARPPLLKQKPAARIESYDYTYDEIMQLKDNDGGHYQQISVAIPVSKTVKRLSDEEFSIEWDAHNLKMTIMKEALEREAHINSSEEFANVDKPSTAQEEIEAQTPEQTMVEDPSLQLTNSAPDTMLEVPSKEKLVRSSTNIDPLETNAPNMRKENNEGNAEAQEQNPTTDELGTHKRKVSVPKKEITVKAAPWANKAPSAPEGPSIIEIQKKEEEEKKRREQELVMKSRKQALKMQQDILKQEQPQVSITSVATWASKTKHAESTANPSNDFEKVYQDRLKEKEFIEEQKRLWEKAQKLYSSSKNASTENDNEWITVTSKQQPKIVPKPIITSAQSVNPDKLRAVSANHNSKLPIRKPGTLTATSVQKQTPFMYSGNASTSARQEFLRWCRSQMKLLPGIEINSVLEMLLSLPAGPESQEIIADTIYSNSNVMDDRRFAAEFIKRRIECEKKLSDPLTWSQALSLPEGEADDWEFQVVSKKKGRRH